MKIGERIKEIRKSRGLSVEEVAEKIDVSVSTLYRYENSSISKVPIDVIDKLSSALGVTTGELMGNAPQTDGEAFMLKMPVLAAYGGYDLESMDDATIVEFANEILSQLKLVSYKYRK